MSQIDYPYLLKEYRKLWNNRQLSAEQNAEEVLKEAILRELKDENSHPRVRKPLYEKYYLATKRIIEGPIDHEDQVKLLQLHIELTSILANELKPR